jgi:hypothetical protein
LFLLEIDVEHVPEAHKATEPLLLRELTQSKGCVLGVEGGVAWKGRVEASMSLPNFEIPTIILLKWNNLCRGLLMPGGVKR